MSFAPQPHPGLPVVPHPAAGELLGSWLLRVAQVYGLDLRGLLAGLDAASPSTRISPPWYGLHLGHLRAEQLAIAMHRSIESIAAMAPPKCERRWPSEVGFCGQCLDEASTAGSQCLWLRHWMHPLALVCEKHRLWLDPVPIRRLRELRNVGELAQLPRKAANRSRLEHQRESALIDGASWLSLRVIQPNQYQPPWGKTDAAQFAKILRSLIQVLMSPAAADAVRHQSGRWPRDLPERRERWACETFRVDDGITSVISLSAPDHLRHRQFVFGLLGHYLRFAPTERSSLKELTTLIAREIPVWQLARWPPEAAKWVSPNPVPPLNYRWPSRRTKQRPSKPAPLFGV